MKLLKDIKIGKADAINYYKTGEKDFLNKIFFNDDKFNDILKREVFFLIGDKGTGKTAYAVYMSNNETTTLKSSLKFTSETDFKKFLRLISIGKINVSDFVNVWKVILLMLISQEIKDNIDKSYLNKLFQLSRIDKAISKYYESAFSPEITNAIEIIDKADVFLEILNELKIKIGNSEKKNTTGFQVNLLEIENEFKKALRNLILKKDFILFIDGTDQVPFDIKRDKYEECLRGLANAIWELNQLIFPELIGDKSRNLKIVLLIRPDIFSIIRFHNANAKLKDNSVILSWITNSRRWKNSRIFKMADNLFSSQQDSKFILGHCWKEYVEENFTLIIAGKTVSMPSFWAILLRTFMRPRDLFAFLDIMHKEAINLHSNKITSQIFNNSMLEYSRYLLGEVKDQFNFFQEDSDWEILIDFITYFDGKVRFDYEYFLNCYERYIDDYPNDNPKMFDSADGLLQELYSNNIICFIEEAKEEDFYKWSFKEKTYTNLYPLVDLDADYMFHSGLLKSLRLGKTVKRRRY